MNEAQVFKQEDFLGEIFENEAKALLRKVRISTLCAKTKKFSNLISII